MVILFLDLGKLIVRVRSAERSVRQHRMLPLYKPKKYCKKTLEDWCIAICAGVLKDYPTDLVIFANRILRVVRYRQEYFTNGEFRPSAHCKLCNTAFKTTTAAKVHAKKIHYSVAVMCKICHRVSKNQHSFGEHVRTTHKVRNVVKAVETYGTIVPHSSPLPPPAE
jgi:hypothetical protein